MSILGAIKSTGQQTFTRLYAANVSAASITNPIPQLARPTGDGVIDASLDNVSLVFFGTVSGGSQTATARVTGWRKTGSLWIPVPLLALSLTFGTQTGVASADVDNNQKFVTTITASTAFTTANEIISPGDNTIAEVKVDFHGCQFIQVDLAKGTCTDINALVSTF